MAQEIGDSLSDAADFYLGRKHGAEIGMLELALYGLRRTYAQIRCDARVPITQISILLGDSSAAKTEMPEPGA
jgi:hypothetical protein